MEESSFFNRIWFAFCSNHTAKPEKRKEIFIEKPAEMWYNHSAAVL